MGVVKFFYGAMGSGKTTKMLAMFDTYKRRKKKESAAVAVPEKRRKRQM